MTPYARILVAVDGSDASDLALDEAIRLARSTGASLRVVHVVDERTFSAARVLFATSGGNVEQLLREIGGEIVRRAQDRVARAGLATESALLDDLDRPMAATIAREARGWHADLLVVGTQGRRGLDRLVTGSGAERILREAPVPVLVVHGPIDEGPSGAHD